MNTLRIGCVVMASGGGARFGGNKLTAELDGRSLIRRALEAVPEAMFQTVAVVSPYGAALDLARAFGFLPVENHAPADGVSRTIALGLDALGEVDGAMFLVSDQPLLRRKSVARLVRRWLEQPESIAALGHGGVRGNPCLFPAWCFPELRDLVGDHGGNTVIRRHEEDLLLLEVPAEELTDVDTPEALERLRRGAV